MPNILLPSESSEDDILQCVICSRALEDAVLLSCLHSACRPCSGGDVSGGVTCPVCHVTTDAPTAPTNLLVSSLARRSLVLKDVFSCTQCSDEDQQDAIAVVWCYTCQHSLCVDCQKFQRKLHSTHKMMHLNEQTNLSELYRPPLRACTEHDEELKFACFSCGDGRCYKCAHDCYTSSHDVLPLDGPVALKRIGDSMTQANTVLSDLNTVLTLLQAHISLPDKVGRAREESFAMLKRTKKTALDSISNAYENAAASFLECWDALVIKSFGFRESAERLKTRVDWTNKYCQLALNSNDVAGLLPQLSTVLSCARACLQEARQFKEPVDPLKLIRVNICLPGDLDLIASGWFGLAKVVSDDFSCSVNDFPSEDSIDYYTRKVSTLHDLEQLLHNQKEQQQNLHHERQSVEKLKSELARKDQQLASMKGNLKQLRQQQAKQKEQLERASKTLEKQQSELASVKQQLVAIQAELTLLRDLQHENLERERRTLEQLQSELKSKAQQLDATQNEVRQLREQEKAHRKHRLRERSMVEELQSDLSSKMQQLAASENEVKQLRENEKELQKHRHRDTRALEQLHRERQHLAPSMPILFDNKPRGTVKCPGHCWDVAVTPKGRLLVAALANGLMVYDATNFQEITTWKPTSVLGQTDTLGVTTVDALADGRALVGLSNLVMLLRCDVGSASNTEVWRAEQQIAKLQAPPRRLSAWGDRLFAVLENRYDESRHGWYCGSGLVLLSLSEYDKELHRQKLDYNALSVALTDRCIAVTSEDEVELTNVVGSGGGSRRKSYVVDCYSHVGVRLWRHVVGGGLKVRSVCWDSVGRVVYAAKRHGSIVALSLDDGRELCTVVSLNAKVTESSYAIGFDKATRRRLALIRFDGDELNCVVVYAVA